MSVSLYDLLDVDRDATPEQIRTAWKGAIADLDPSDRRFRAYNQAAEVLLDPERRATYDAELEAAEPEPEPEPAAPPPAEPVATAPAPEADAAAPPTTAFGRRFGQLATTTWLLVGLLALTFVLAGTAVWLTRDQPSDADIERALRTAEGVAQTAVPAIFSYDYRHLDEDHDKAAAYLTDDYRTKTGGYDDIFESVIEVNAPRLKAVVESQFVSSGIVRTGGGEQADDRVEVLVVFDILETNKQSTEPRRSPAYAVVTMENVGGDWLVDEVKGPDVPQ